MPKKDNRDFTDLASMDPGERLKFEIAAELGLADRVQNHGWKSLTSKESGRIGGLITKRKRELASRETTKED